MIFLLSISAPIVPSSTLLCLTVLLSQMGAPVAAVSILSGMDAVIEMLQAVSDITGDVTITLMIAGSENLQDLPIYQDTTNLK